MVMLHKSEANDLKLLIFAIKHKADTHSEHLTQFKDYVCI